MDGREALARGPRRVRRRTQPRLRRQAGGAEGLAALLTERWPLVEADLQRYYQLDLRHEVEHTGVRRLLALIDGLPDEAATWREERGTWSREDELLAQLIESVEKWSSRNEQLQAAYHLGRKSSQVNTPGATVITHPERPSSTRSSTARKKPTRITPDAVAALGGSVHHVTS